MWSRDPELYVIPRYRHEQIRNWLRDLAEICDSILSWHCRVTLGDDLARKRGTQKSVQERAAPPTFDVAIELLDRRKWCIHPDIGKAVDSILSGMEWCLFAIQASDNSLHAQSKLGMWKFRMPFRQDCIEMTTLIAAAAHARVKPTYEGDALVPGQKPSVEVRQQDENGKVHKVASQSESFSEAAKEAQAQSSRAQLMRNITATRLEVSNTSMHFLHA